MRFHHNSAVIPEVGQVVHLIQRKHLTPDGQVWHQDMLVHEHPPVWPGTDEPLTVGADLPIEEFPDGLILPEYLGPWRVSEVRFPMEWHTGLDGEPERDVADTPDITVEAP